MKKINKKRFATLIVVSLILLFGTYAGAESRCFAYNFTHYLPGYVYYGKKDTIKITLTVDKWGSKEFTVKQVKNGIFSSKTYAKKKIQKKNGNKQTIKFSNHGGCQYEFWKASDGKKIEGVGKIVW